MLLFLIFLPSIFFVLLIFVFNPLFFPFVLIGLISILTSFYKRNKKRKIIQEIELKESLNEGGLEEPTSYRDLLPSEKVTLEKIIKEQNKLINNVWLRLMLLIGLFILAFRFHIYLLDSKNIIWIIYYPVMFVFEIILLFYTAKTVISYFLKQNIYHDLRVQVFKAAGKLIKEKTSYIGAKKYTIIVRGVEFSHDSLVDVIEAVEQLGDGDQVAIEYSPSTKHVWKIYKTEDL